MMTNNKGFTLVELMITLVVATVIIMAIYASYIIQQKSYYAQSDIIDMQQNIRAALEVMVRDIRMAGYDPTESGKAGFRIEPSSGSPYSGAEQTQITFSKDSFDDDNDGNPGNGDVNDSEETLNYRLYTSGGKQNVGREDLNGGSISAVAENIELLRFRYQLDDGTWQNDVLPGQTSHIRTVQIIVIALANQPTPNFVSGSFELPDGTTYTPATKTNHHRRMLVTSVNCRNMGI